MGPLGIADRCHAGSAANAIPFPLIRMAKAVQINYFLQRYIDIYSFMPHTSLQHRSDSYKIFAKHVESRRFC